MSNITPIRSPQMMGPPGPQPAPQWGGPPGWMPPDGWFWDGTQWVCAPPCPPPPCPPPPCPPPQHCGPPSCFSAVAKAQACFDQTQALTNLITSVVQNIFAQNPGIIPTPPPSKGTGPILGVTDGSMAAPGEVGEFVWANAVLNWNIPNGTYPSQTVAPLILQPGDWGVQAQLQSVIPASIVDFQQSPVNPALNPPFLHSGAAIFSPSSGEIWLTTGVSQLSVSVPTVLPFLVAVDNTTGATVTGQTTVWVTARRSR